MNPRHVTLPTSYEAQLRKLLSELNLTLENSNQLADCVLRLSDFYLANPNAPTPWRERWAQAASLAYYFPLNYARARAVALEGERLGFFKGIDRLFDFGSGMGAALHAFADELNVKGRNIELSADDISGEALALGRALAPADRRIHEPFSAGQGSMLLASYVLTELSRWPQEWDRFDAIAVIEPATQHDARRLQSEREPLIEKGFRIWAPCTHEKACPMLLQSKKDWCHDRIHFDQPAWFSAIEKHLPIKNKTLTASYLLAKRSAPPLQLQGLARLVGDRLEEKGKFRQALCQDSERTFLSWFPQRMEKSDVIDLERGSLVQIKAGLERKPNELRLKHPSEIIELLPDQTLDSVSAESL